MWGGKIKVYLISFDGGQMVMKVDDERDPIRIINRGGDMKFGALPGGLITKPTLVWLLDAEKGGEHLAKVTYQASNISWNAHYTLVTAKDDKKVDLSGWVTLTNNTGAGYNNAELKLVAGDIHRVTAQGAPMGQEAYARKESKGAVDRAGFVEKAFFEYHLYTLGRKT